MCDHEDDEELEEQDLEEEDWVEEVPCYPLGLFDLGHITLRTLGNVIGVVGSGVHAVATELAAAAQHRRRGVIAEAVRREAAEAMGLIEKGPGS